MKGIGIATVVLFAALGLLGQTPAPDTTASQTPVVPQWQIAAGGRMAFEVASIRQSRPGAGPDANFPLDAGEAYVAAGGRFTARFPLTTYIKFAYKLSLTPDQIQSMVAGLPKWVAGDLFDIQALAAGNPTKDQMRMMMQSLLAERFRLAVHFETRQVSLFALTPINPGKLGPSLIPHANGPICDAADTVEVFPPRCDVATLESIQNGTHRWGYRNATMEMVARAFGASFDRPVIDQTGLSGRFDVTLEWMPTPQDAPPPDQAVLSGPRVLTFGDALHDQLGLKLVSMKGPVETLVIDHVERPSEN
jgi:bla regulator protein BlaR1